MVNTIDNQIKETSLRAKETNLFLELRAQTGGKWSAYQAISSQQLAHWMSLLQLDR